MCLLSVGTGVTLRADPGPTEPCADWALEVRICRWDIGCYVAAFSGGLCLVATLFLHVSVRHRCLFRAVATSSVGGMPHLFKPAFTVSLKRLQGRPCLL